MRSPGTTPPRKSRPTETPETNENTTMGMLGGKIGPMIEEAAVQATANLEG